MAELQYIDNYNNPQANVTKMTQSDYLVSPSGVYNGVINPNGTFSVSYGNVPNTQPVLWTSASPGGPVGPYWVQSTPWWSTSQYYVWANCNCTNPIGGSTFLTDAQLAVNQDYNTAPDFMQLDDDGILRIYQGNNGIKTNPNEASVQTRTPGTSNPITAITLNTITYDTADTVYNSINKVAGLASKEINSTPTTEAFTYNLSLAYTNSETFSWEESAQISGTISSSTKVSVPGIGDQTETISLSAQVQIKNGQSETDSGTLTQQAGGTVSVPADSEYDVDEIGYDQVATVPYTWTGIAFYKNGYSAPITGSGSVVSDTTGVFSTEITCVYTPTGCGLGGAPTPIPEPSTLVTVPMAFAAMLLLAAVRRRRARGSSRSGFGMLTPA
jgi:hypothetical protein